MRFKTVFVLSNTDQEKIVFIRENIQLQHRFHPDLAESLIRGQFWAKNAERHVKIKFNSVNVQLYVRSLSSLFQAAVGVADGGKRYLSERMFNQ